MLLAARTRAKALWAKARDIKFGVYKVTQNFSPSARLSNITLRLKKCCYLSLGSLVHFDESTLLRSCGNEFNDNAVKMLLPLLQKRVKLDLLGDTQENAVMKQLVRHVLGLLCCTTTLEIKYKYWIEAEYEGNPGPVAASLGIGCKEPGHETWYGSPDARLRGSSPPPRDPAVHDVALVCIEEVPPETKGNSLSVELKLRAKALSQSVATAVVSAFTENKLHPNDNSVVPTLLINCRSARVILYDAVQDYLLISDHVDLFTVDNETVDENAIFFLWLFINHRCVYCHVCNFLKNKLTDTYRLFLGTLEGTLEKSTIHSRLAADGKLANFQELRQKDSNWQSPETFVQSDMDANDTDLVDYETGPPPRKRPAGP